MLALLRIIGPYALNSIYWQDELLCTQGSIGFVEDIVFQKTANTLCDQMSQGATAVIPGHALDTLETVHEQLQTVSLRLTWHTFSQKVTKHLSNPLNLVDRLKE